MDVVRNFNRQALHSAVLSFEHPVSGVICENQAPWPSDLSKLVGALGGKELAGEI